MSTHSSPLFSTEEKGYWTVDMLALSAPTVVEMGDVAGVGDRRRNLVVKKC